MNHSTSPVLKTQLPTSALTTLLQPPETLLELAFLVHHFQHSNYIMNQTTKWGNRSFRKIERESKCPLEKGTPQKQKDRVWFKAGLCVRRNMSFYSSRRLRSNALLHRESKPTHASGCLYEQNLKISAGMTTTAVVIYSFSIWKVMCSLPSTLK